MRFDAGLCNPEEFSFTIDGNPCEQAIQNLEKNQKLSRKSNRYAKNVSKNAM